ncbi:hypothetical protein AB5J55_41055 [Streptomyces sp. R11]|uniref:Uncharacterized protein n=1 Tax=Streptomyces sp. R11 TaxID=3238625 RepID=A0AB39NDR7_9ACTN
MADVNRAEQRTAADAMDAPEHAGHRRETGGRVRRNSPAEGGRWWGRDEGAQAHLGGCGSNQLAL